MLKNKQGLSGIITMLIIIALVLVAIGAVWYVIQNVLEQGKTETEEATGDIFADCATEGGVVSNETATCVTGEKRLIGGEYCCI